MGTHPIFESYFDCLTDMSDFKVRNGALKLKGQEDLLAKKAKKKAKKEKKKAKKRKLEEESKGSDPTDEEAHGGWYKYGSFEELKPGLSGLEFGDRAYVFSLDTGLFTLGEPRKEEGAPQPE